MRGALKNPLKWGLVLKLGILLAVLCLGAVVSASASTVTYTVNITGVGGPAGTGCALDVGQTGTITITTGVTDTFEFTAANDCYAGANGPGITATPDFGASTCSSGGYNCSTLGSPVAGKTYLFSNQTGAGGFANNAGECENATDCTKESLTYNLVVVVPSAGFSSSSNTAIQGGGSNPDQSQFDIQVDDAKLVTTPEPSSMLLLGVGLLALGLAGASKRKLPIAS
jgi:PEP-CTERM motif